MSAGFLVNPRRNSESLGLMPCIVWNKGEHSWVVTQRITLGEKK